MFDTMEVKKDMERYFKAENVVLSSLNLGQLMVAKRYVESYYKETEDKSGFEVLMRKFYKKYQELSLE